MRTFLSSTRMPVILSVALIGLILIAAQGQVSFEASYYNSEGSLSEVITAENGKYGGISILDPTDSLEGFPSISSSGNGRSNGGRSSKFSYSATSTTPENSEKVSAVVEVQSGGYEWGKSAEVSSNGPSAKAHVAGGTNGGSIDASFHNTDFSLDKEANCKNSIYSFAASVTHDSITSIGMGLEAQSARSPGKPEADFSLDLEAEAFDKRVLMDTGLEEQLTAIRYSDFTFRDITKISASDASMASILVFEPEERWTFAKSFIERPNSPHSAERPSGAPEPVNTNPITAGMMFQAIGLNGRSDLSETRYVPKDGELGLSMKPGKDIDEILRLSMTSWWYP